ncbi:hypothetical protein AA101099_0674 [Neoasaia chiangmaiensis NBRC 101099]|nr:hypothetical protein AA101099_0674 [Neoasaia chiangmaiensis NBRC 101099]GEN14901.1 hypothetical protein NCH01_13320 [Neoasaia chiangmaiensis]
MNSTLDGDLLAGIVFTQRHDVHYAGGALYAAVHDGMTDPVFISTALHFVAMDAGDNAAERAVDLASKLQDDNLARLVLGNQAIYRDDWSKALGIFQTDRTPPSFLTFLAPVLQAWCLFAQGKGGAALAILHKAPHQDIMGSLATLQEARLAAILNDQSTRGLFDHLDQSAAAFPPIIRYMMATDEAAWRVQMGDRAAATQTLRNLGQTLPAFQLVAARLSPEILSRKPVHVKTEIAAYYTGLAALLAAIDDNHAAHDLGMRQFRVIVLRQALRLAPDMTITKLVLAEELRDGKQLTAAQAALDGIDASDPLAPIADHTRASIALQRNDLPAALAALRRVVVADPANADVLDELGTVEDQSGLAREAVKSFTQALGHVSVMQATTWPILLGRAIAYDHLGERNLAQADLDRAIALAPKEPQLLNYAGYADVEHGERPAQAIELLSKAAALAPNDPEIRDSYAWALLKQNGDLDRALPLLVSAAGGAPGDAEIAYHLGVAYWYRGRQIEARDQWNQALADKPEAATRALIEKALREGPSLTRLRDRPIPAPR